MPRTHAPKPHRRNHDVPTELEQPELPAEPHDGLIPPLIPEDPEHDRLIDPAAMRPEEGRRRAKAPRSVPGLPLSNKRDQSPDPVIVQAKRDIDAGMVDTDMHSTPGLDAKLRARLVPGPGGKPLPGR